MTETTTTMNSKYSSIVDTSSDDSDSGDDAPQAVSAKDAANSEKQRQAKDERRRAAQRKVRKATSQKQANRPKKAASAASASTLDGSSDTAPSTASSLPSTSTASSSKLDPALFEQAEEAFRAVKEAAIRAAAEDQARQSAAGAGGGATGKTAAKSAGSLDKGKKRKLDDADYVAAIQKAEKAKTRTMGDVTVQQLDSTAPPTSSASSAPPKHASVDVSSALPANKTRAFLQDRLFKRRRSNTVAGPSSRKKRGKQAEKPHLIFDPLLDKKPVKKEKTRTEKKEALRERMRGRQGAVTAFTRGNSQTMAAGFGFKRQ